MFTGLQNPDEMDSEYHKSRLELAEKLLLQQACNGELWAIQNLLLITAEAIRDGCPLTIGIAAFMHYALGKIYIGEKADVAFGIVRKRGEKDTRESQQRAFGFAHMVECRRKYHDETLEIAVEKVAALNKASDNTVKAAWQQFHKDAAQLIRLDRKYRVPRV